MKALTICQPYVALIMSGEKLVENRKWSTNYRGQLLIHAGKSRQWLSDTDEQDFAKRSDPLVFGSVVGSVILTDVLHIDCIRQGDYDVQYSWLRKHIHAHGTWCWVLQDVKRYTHPVPWRGGQGLWNFPDTII